MIITVMVPTYRRSQDLARCLDALSQQTRLADRVLLVVRDTDTETWEFLKTLKVDRLPLQTVTVSASGQVAALNAGLDAVVGDIIAITDDDATPHVDWLARIEAHFLSDLQIGGVGGRDWVYYGTRLEDGMAAVVGKLQWFGRVIGNHHIGTGEAREVDVLKGANMSFRRTAIAGQHFNQNLRGTGAQVHNEISFCLRLRRTGWKLIYDPAVAVNHYPSQRFDADQRNQFNSTAAINATYNETMSLLEHLSPVSRLMFLLWAVLVGTRQSVGLIQWLRLLPQQGLLANQKLVTCLRGRWQAWQAWQEQSVN